MRGKSKVNSPINVFFFLSLSFSLSYFFIYKTYIEPFIMARTKQDARKKKQRPQEMQDVSKLKKPGKKEKKRLREVRKTRAVKATNKQCNVNAFYPFFIFYFFFCIIYILKIFFFFFFFVYCKLDSKWNHYCCNITQHILFKSSTSWWLHRRLWDFSHSRWYYSNSRNWSWTWWLFVYLWIKGTSNYIITCIYYVYKNQVVIIVYIDKCTK